MKNSGFTIVELIAIIAVLGILAAVAMPRFMGKAGFESRGFFDQTQAVIRYAQKIAIAQRRTVFVNIDTNRVTACFVNDASFPECAAGGGVIDPSTGVALSVSAPSAISLSPAPTTFSYNGLGQPSFGATLTVVLTSTASGDINRNIVIENETGYVHN